MAAGLPEALAHMIVGWDIAAAQGALYDGSQQLSRLLRRPTTPLSMAVADALGAAGRVRQ
jgi:NAD(P)H dehydrogenase (quinone)